MPYPRMTTRRWMIAVMIIAVLCGGAMGLWRRSLRFAERAQEFARFREVFAQMNQGDVSRLYDNPVMAPGEPGMDAEARERAAESARLVRYYTEMEAKYREAARRPWMPVSPDPPEPE